MGFWEADPIDLLFAASAQDSFAAQDATFLQQFGFIPGLKEIVMLRQVHALEHATVWVLSGVRSHQNRTKNPQPADNELLGGMSTDQGFYLYGQVDTGELKRAVHAALHRIVAGEWDLAVHPRCGTNLSVGMVLTAGLAVGMSAILPRDPVGQMVGVGIAAVAAAQLTPDLGGLAQRYVTTAIPFNLAIASIAPVPDPFGRPAHFVRVKWVES